MYTNYQQQTIVLFFSIVLLLSACLSGAKGAKKSKNVRYSHYVTIDSIAFPLDKCMSNNVEKFGEAINNEAYCRCVTQKLYTTFKSDSNQLKQLTQGNVHLIIADLDAITRQKYASCFTNNLNNTSAPIKLSSSLEEHIRNNMLEELENTSLARTNNVALYCDCFINNIKSQVSSHELFDEAFSTSPKYLQIDSLCTATSIIEK